MANYLYRGFIAAMIMLMFGLLGLVGLHPAFAGGYVAPVIHVSSTVEHERPFNWSGFYAGGSVGKQSADLSKSEENKIGWDGETPIYEYFKTRIDDSDTTYGVFAGYRYQFDNRFVVGAEASYSRSGKLFDDSFPTHIESYGVEAQAGFAFGRALPYVAAGYADVEGEDALSLSVGLDYAVTDRFFVGAKYTRYDVGEVTGIESVRGFEADSDLVALRAGFRF